MLILPAQLQAAIKHQLATMPEARWLRAAQALSERYRSTRDTAERLAHGEEAVLGYLALILPATYAQLCGALAAAAARVPFWQPKTMLDLGSGPGTALWAAAAQWPTLEYMEAWERERDFIAVGKRLAAYSDLAVVRHTSWRQCDLQHAVPQGSYDLVVLGHVLNELDPQTQQAVVQAAWAITSGMLVIVEPGTSSAFPVVRAARDMLLEQGAHTIAPCAHNTPCPLENDWCHFPQRVERPDFQRNARGALSTWEDSKFSYAALARFPTRHTIWGRVIREPTWNKAYAEATISSAEGIVVQRALKRNKQAFKHIKKLAWGEALEGTLQQQEDKNE